jgi:zinc/manganese transport system substrate-binding protein
MKSLVISAVLAAAAIATPAQALNVFACEPEWGALATAIGGDKVSVYVATNGLQDPHQVQARPSLIAKARSADIAVCTGADLEIAWLPMIAQQANNTRVSNAFFATNFVRLLEQPVKLDRAEGDIHAGGNPHVQADPRNLIPISRALTQRFGQLDPANAAGYTARQADFEKKLTAAIAGWQAKAAPLKGISIAVQHHSWTYLENWLGMIEVTPLEPKPGVPPSSGYLAQVLGKLQATPVKFVMRAAYEDGRPTDFIAQRAKIPAVVLPFTIGGSDQAKDLFSFYDDTINKLLAGLK